MSQSIIISCFACLLATIGQCQQKKDIENAKANPPQQEQSFYAKSPAIWEATIYIHKNDSLYAGKEMPTSKRAKPDLMMLPDSLNQLPYELALGTFSAERKAALKSLKQWFGFTIYLDSEGVLKELKFTLPNKFAQRNASLCLNENDLLKIDQRLKGLQLVLPEWWKELGYASINYAIRFEKLEL